MGTSVKHNVWIGLGTNLGERRRNLADAIIAIEDSGCGIKATSGIYESEPWGYDSEHSFYNQCILVKTNHSPEKLLKIFKKIEMHSGRTMRNGTYTDRVIDLDILYYDNMVIHSDDLKIPHPMLKERLFVLKPLAEISPLKTDPVVGLTIAEMLKNCPDKSWIHPLSPE